MAQNNIYGSKAAKFYDRDKIPGYRVETATQIGIVKDKLSPARDGRIKVWFPLFGGDQNDPHNLRPVSYANPLLIY